MAAVAMHKPKIRLLKPRLPPETFPILQGAPLTMGIPNVFQNNIPLGEGWYRWRLRVNLNVVIGTGTGAITEGELLIIKRILFEPDVGEAPINASGRMLWKNAIRKSRTLPQKTAIAAATGIEGKLTDFNVSSVTGGVDALGDVIIQLDAEGIRVSGRGVSTDVVEASARAYLNAVNRVIRVRDRKEALEERHHEATP